MGVKQRSAAWPFGLNHSVAMKGGGIYHYDNQSEGGARNGLLNPCARLLVGLAHPKVSFFLLSFFLRTGARTSAREICRGATLGGGPVTGLGVGSRWAWWACGGLVVGLRWACGGLGGLLVGFWWAWWAFGGLLVGFWWAFGGLLVGFWWAFGGLLVGF